MDDNFAAHSFPSSMDTGGSEGSETSDEDGGEALEMGTMHASVSGSRSRSRPKRRRSKPSKLRKRDSQLKATGGGTLGRVHFDSDVADGDGSSPDVAIAAGDDVCPLGLRNA